jgi:hypothetical protein
MTTIWDGSYPPSVLFPPQPPTGATAGTPGAWTPSGSVVPTTLAEANALGLSLGAAWATGQYVLLANGSTHIHWNGTAFASGNAAVTARKVDPAT